MDKATTGAVLGTILGLLAGIGGMVMFGAARDTASERDQLEEKLALQAGDQAAQKDEISRLKAELDRLRNDAVRAREGTKEIADGYDRLSEDKAAAEERARKLKDELDKLKGGGAEAARQNEARIAELEKLLEENGILAHLSPEEIQRRMTLHKDAFELAFSTKDKKKTLEALREMQRLGPAAYDEAISMWKKVAEDFGMNPFGQGPGTLGLNFQEYTSLISSYGLLQKGLTDPGVDSAFRIAALYGVPWWTSESGADRAKLVGDLLQTVKGYEAGVAIEALRDIQDPSTTRYLSEYLLRNTDDGPARMAAVNALQRKNTDDAWAAIEHTAKNDPDEKVRRHAQAALAARNVAVEGVLITWVGENSQGSLAGIKVNDILTHYNGVRIKTLEDVNRAKQSVAPDQTVTVLVNRAGEEVSLQLGPGTIGINGQAVAPRK
ncbi:MAG: PDZ domain-containing protein [Planctomycetes bacterium]|nr:PDZ domain-containing protein [Planctomycetota bacterium]